MTSDPEALAAWASRLLAAEADLREREEQALADAASPAVLAAFATERDRIALGRDRIADRYDEQAGTRDQAALGRDAYSSGRDRRAREPFQDEDPGWSDRFVSGEDRDRSAGDRADSHEDRARAHGSREQAATDRRRAAVDRDRATAASGDLEHEVQGLRAALGSRQVIGQAQGLLMTRYAVSSETAFAVLVRLSQHANAKLRDVAERLVQDAEPPPPAEGGGP